MQFSLLGTERIKIVESITAKNQFFQNFSCITNLEITKKNRELVDKRCFTEKKKKRKRGGPIRSNFGFFV